MSTRTRRQSVWAGDVGLSSGAARGEQPTRHARARVLAVLSAVGGRYGWRWWLPVAVWISRAIVGRITMSLSPVGIRIDDIPAGWFLLSSLVALLVLWGWGSRFALSLGHRRSHVFVTMAVASVLLLAAVQLVSSVANQVEMAVVGPDGPRVLALGVGDKLGTDSGVLYAGLAAAQIYLMPVAFGLILALCWTMRWSVVGMAAGVATAAGLIFGMLAVWAVADKWIPGPEVFSGLMVMGLCVGLMLALAWMAFRRVRV